VLSRQRDHSSALDSLEAINERLNDHGLAFHLSEVKGLVMDRLQRTSFLECLMGRIFLSQFLAANELDGSSDGQIAHVVRPIG